MTWKTACIALMAATFSCNASAAESAAAPLVLRATYLFDGVSGRIASPAQVVVHGERIVAVGTALTLPADARVLDLGNVTLMPGFIDAHVHISDQMSDNTYKDDYEALRRLPAEDGLRAAHYARRVLEAGFTTVRNLDSDGFVDVSLRNAIAGGFATGPTIIASGNCIGVPGGHCDRAAFNPQLVPLAGPMEGTCSGAESCREAVRYQMKWGADVIKVCASGGVLSASDPLATVQLSAAELTAMVAEAHAWNRKVAAHAHGDQGARNAIEAGVDSIEHGTFLTPPTLRLMKEKGVYLVPTRLAVEWVAMNADQYPAAIAAKARQIPAAHAATLREALRIGVPIAFGTDAGVFPHGINAREFGLMVKLGMAPSAALLSSTREAARLLGVEAEVGSLEAGKIADIVAVPGSVIDDITASERPAFVMTRGRIVRQ